MNKLASFFKKKSYLFKHISVIISAFLWLLIWEISALLVNKSFLFPGAIETLGKLFTLLIDSDYWIAISISILRIFTGLLLGIIFAIITVIICRVFPITHTFISIGMTVIKSTPVAAVIMILWMFIDSQLLPIAIALLMVCPIIWQNLMNGFGAINNELEELTIIFNFTQAKKLKYLIIPTLQRFFIPAVLTSVGLAWKAGIASEIISYAKLSIGKNIYDAKWMFDGPAMLAWTLSVVLISLILENAIKYFTRRFLSIYEY